MIIGWFRLVFFLLIGSTIAYAALAIYLRSTQRETLEHRWQDERLTGDREAWIEAQLLRFNKSLKRRLLWLVYVVPMVACSAIFFYSNWGRL